MEKSITVNIQDNKYEVDFPTAGDMIDIEVRKSIMSRNQYFGLLNTSTVTSNFALDLIDTAATFSVLIPELMDDLNVDSILDLSIPDSKELVDVYKEQFSPWYEQWLEVIKGGAEDEKARKTKKEVVEDEG